MPRVDKTNSRQPTSVGKPTYPSNADPGMEVQSITNFAFQHICLLVRYLARLS